MTVRILFTPIKRPDPFSAAFPEDAEVRIVLGAERARQEGLRAAAEDDCWTATTAFLGGSSNTLEADVAPTAGGAGSNSNRNG